MPGACESRLLNIRALLASRFHIPQIQRPYYWGIRQVDDFTVDLFEAMQFDDDTRKAVDALQAAQANTMKLLNMLLEYRGESR